MDQEIVSLVREVFVEGLEDLVTDPNLSRFHLPTDLPEKVRRGEKIEYCGCTLDRFAGVCDDLRLPSKDSVALREVFFSGIEDLD